METLQEQDIFKHIKHGNREKAVALMYKMYFPKVRAYIVSRGGRVDDAKDIFQEAILSFYLKVMDNRVKEEGVNVGGFIMRVAQNSWVDKIRKDKKIEFNDSLNSAVENIELKESSLLSILTKENNQIVENVLASLGAKCKELLTFSMFYNLSMKEIAIKLGFASEESAKTQHYKCKQKLISSYRENNYLKELLRGAGNV